ncbi:50S ribosomal protein L25/general stress protein Ctc [Bacillus sp. V3B]|uniref:50S ribosomal protein L25/general stress protein Ctc n=1 Tax=Bacillus sp. V3B TaxID=2804915 RepID=UPI00210C6400|nr:50S ribosomal protein L25/general stress protein Ctc [Bacillus sp. V3B]MCQ6276719.1 50S ribosomal protein L25/general stress protein Ctc [Bacillus sp. V3B]
MNTVLQAKERKLLRHSALTSIRKEGNIPAVVYGSTLGSKSIYLNEIELLKTIKDVGRNGIIALDVEGNRQNVILTDYQIDPLKNGFVHADFLAIDMSKELTTDVRVVLTGDAAGVKDGGVMQQQSLHEVSVTATPANIPQSVDIDVANLQVGETITIADIKANSQFTINHEDDEVVASILAPRQEVEISTGEEQAEGTPENLEGRETNPNNPNTPNK